MLGTDLLGYRLNLAHTDRLFSKTNRIVVRVRRVHRYKIPQPGAVGFLNGVAMARKPQQDGLILVSAFIENKALY